MKKYEFIEYFKIKGTPIMVHWTTSLLLLLLISTALSQGELPIIALALFSIILIHELGHLWFALRLGLRSTKIDIYPIAGLCHYESPQTEYEEAIVAWGGVVFQACIFVPVLIVSYFIDGSTSYVHDILYSFGTLNLIIAIINLLPIAPLDGSICWRWFPLYFKHRSKKKKARKNIPDYQKRFDKERRGGK